MVLAVKAARSSCQGVKEFNLFPSKSAGEGKVLDGETLFPATYHEFKWLWFTVAWTFTQKG